MKVPKNAAGDKYPYNVVLGEHGSPEVGAGIFEVVAEYEARSIAPGEHPVEYFRDVLSGLRRDRYPSGVVPLPGVIDGTAFFSAGPGLFCEDPPSEVGLPPFPFGGTMIVGNNLDADEPYRRRLASGIPHGDLREPMRTWRNLYRLLDGAGVDVRSCFFTNAYVGLVAGSSPTRRFPGATDTAFASWCQLFLQAQIEILRPSVVVSIGGDARRFLGKLGGELRDWERRPSTRVHHGRIGDIAFRAVALAHPSMYPVSATGREFGGRRGVEADAALLRAALDSPEVR